MSKNNGSLSAIDFLGLAEQKQVGRVDLAEAGAHGVVYVCGLSTAKQREVMSRPRKGKTRVYADKSLDINWADLPDDAAPKFLAACLVTDKEGGALLARAFAALEPGEEQLITIDAGELIYFYDQWKDELGTHAAVMKRLEELPNSVSNLIIRRVREISGMEEDEIEEKKGN